MFAHQTYRYDREISEVEYEVIDRFLKAYRNQKIMIADQYRQDFTIVPFEDDRIMIKTNEDIWKSVDFRKGIYHKGNFYVVELSLWRSRHTKNDPECLQMKELKIITNEEAHVIHLDLEDYRKNNLLFQIISIFDEKKVISPMQAYGSQMYTDSTLQGLLENHKWENIDKGIQQMPSLANALFMMRKGQESATRYTADFGTILYQLVFFRTHNIGVLSEKDLRELDKLILKLSKTNLLKVHIMESRSNSKSWPPSSILLSYNDNKSGSQCSQQYTVDNTELLEENEVVKELVKSSKSNQ